MERMVDYIKHLSEVNTDGVEPLINVFEDKENVFREDVISNGDTSDKILYNAPCKSEDLFVVPKTV